MKTALFLVLFAVAAVFGAEEKKTEKRGVLGLGYGGYPSLGLYNHGIGPGLYGGSALLGGHGLYGGVLGHGSLVAPPLIGHGVVGSPLIGGHGLIGAPVVGPGLYGGLGPWGLGLGHGVLH